MPKAKIMLVEDERIIAMDMKHKLKKMGYAVAAHVASGEEALRRVEEVQPDLILMDIMLEGELDGIQTTEAIREHSAVPVIYATAYTDDDTRRRVAGTTHSGYLTKPVDETLLRTALEKALAGSPILDEPPSDRQS